MSPRRMDISSLLRDPSPDDPHTAHRPPPSLLSILNPNPRPPFLGLDALVHVASEEHRRISAGTADRDLRERVHDHDRPSRHYTHPFHHTAGSLNPAPPSPRSPLFPLPLPPSSPSTRIHPSASPPNIYSRNQPILHMEPTRSAPPLLGDPVHDPRHSPPFPYPAHSSPCSGSPLRHSPHHVRSQHHSSPTHMPSSPGADPISPRYGHGPRMAGGIEILSSDSPRPHFQSPACDLSTERFVPEPRGHELLKLSPLSVRSLSPEHPMQHRESESLARSHFPSVDTLMDNVTVPPREVDFRARPTERHPIRVWEEQSTCISPVYMPAILHGPAEGHGLPAKQNWATELLQDAPVPPPSTSTEQPLSRASAPEPSPAKLQIPTKVTPRSTLPTPPRHRSPVLSELQPLPPHTLCLSPRASASPVLDLHAENPEAQVGAQPERSDTQPETSNSAPLTTSDPIMTEPMIGNLELIPGQADGDDIHMANPTPRQPSPELVQPMLAEEPGCFGLASHPNPANVPQTTGRSTLQLPTLLPAKDEHVPPLEDVLISPPTHPASSRRSPEPEDSFKQEAPVSEPSMMDVDEELLSLVEDRSARVTPTMPKVQVEPRLFPPATVARSTSASTERGSSEVFIPSSQQVSKGPPRLTDEENDRTSMPPPVARSKKPEKDRSAGSKKKKEGSSKPPTKTKQPPKPRPKAASKTKVKPSTVDILSKGNAIKSAVNLSERSRSTSVIPGVVDDVVLEPDADDSEKEDDKLYCVCKTRYDEDRMMIACDRCDEWFHTLCVNMPDMEIDLVDQFICPLCIQKYPHLRTTWKRRCLFGLQHEHPSSPAACHKPSRGAFSKYCSDECGIKCMRARIEQWEKSGGARNLLWECVKKAPKREGVVACAGANGSDNLGTTDIDGKNAVLKPLDSAAKRRAEREVTCLNARLGEVVKEREFMKRELDMVMWREKVVDLASERAGKVDECGWDQRLCFGEEEWADFGLEVLESYEEERVEMEPGDDAMPVDATSAVHGEWWCTGKKKCERHAGWQKLRAAEVSFDKETKEGLLLKLTTREREIRKRIEDLLYPQPTGTLQATSKLQHPNIQVRVR